MAFDPLQPYGPVVESSARIATWNVWGRHGEWRQREAALEAALESCRPDVVCLTESWSADETTQAEVIADHLGVPYSLFVGDWKEKGRVSEKVAELGPELGRDHLDCALGCGPLASRPRRRDGDVQHIEQLACLDEIQLDRSGNRT